MKQESLIAGALVLFCAVTAVGTWFKAQPSHEDKQAKLEAPSFGHSNDIAQLDVQGMIVDSGSPGGFGGGGSTSASAMLKAIRKIREDGNPVVLLNINSPGGTASASQAVYDELQRLKRDKKTKVVAAMGDLAASGAYYIASAADEIVANPATLTGSIGVIMHTQNLTGLMGKLGVDNGAIKSGANKDIGSPFRPMRPDEKRILQGIVNDTYDQFLTAVSTGRKIPVGQLRPLADGRIFTGRQALPLKLVDKLGNYTVAVEEARRLGGLSEDAEPKNYSEGGWKDFFQNMFSSSSQLAPLNRVLGSPVLPEKTPLMIYE